MATKKVTVATIADDVRALRGEAGEFKEEMREFIADMREFRSEMREFRTETRAEFASVREEIRAGDQATRTHMTILVESLRDDMRICMDAHLDLERRVRRLESRE